MNLSGCCTVGNADAGQESTETCYYAPFTTVTKAMQLCATGMFSTEP